MGLDAVCYFDLSIANETKPGVLSEKRGKAALFTQNSGFCLINILANFSKTLDFAYASRTQNQGF